MSIEENKAIARRWSDEVWGKGDLAAMDELFATDLVFHYPGTQGSLEDYKQSVTEWFAAFPNSHGTTEEMVAEGDKVAVRWTWGGTQTGEFWGIAYE